jgi:hypothetical protein
MASDGQSFRKTIGDVTETSYARRVALSDPVADPVDAHVRCFGHVRVTVLEAMLTAHLLSQNNGNGVGECGLPILARIFLPSVAMRAAAYRPAYFASATQKQTTGMRTFVGQADKIESTGDAACPRAGEVGCEAPCLGRLEDFPTIRMDSSDSNVT